MLQDLSSPNKKGKPFTHVILDKRKSKHLIMIEKILHMILDKGKSKHLIF